MQTFYYMIGRRFLICFALLLSVLLFAVACSDTPSDTAAPKESIETTSEKESVETEENQDTILSPDETEEDQDPDDDPDETKKPQEEIFVRGIDVSHWQGVIDWQKVKNAGIEFAMIRLGSFSGGECTLDSKAIYNLQQAEKSGVLIGVYFYSGARLPQDARAEAKWVLEQIAGFAISYPVVLDWEMDSYKKDVTAAVRTDTALAFLQEIENAGYEAMLYTQQIDFESDSMWQKNRILGNYPVWVARYSAVAYPDSRYPEGNRDYAMWQYSDKGRVDGIQGNVDLNVSYFKRSYTPPKNASLRPQDEESPVDFKQTFQSVELRLTAKDHVNLRKTPSTSGELVGTLKKGEFLTCTGISDMGWARLKKGSETVYAVYSYLSETVIEDVVDPAAGHTFRTVREEVTAKTETNLRTAPTTDGELVYTLPNGEYVTRTGIGDRGWDRLEYQGKTVYAVSSFLMKKE